MWQWPVFMLFDRHLIAHLGVLPVTTNHFVPEHVIVVLLKS